MGAIRVPISALGTGYAVDQLEQTRHGRAVDTCWRCSQMATLVNEQRHRGDQSSGTMMAVQRSGEIDAESDEAANRTWLGHVHPPDWSNAATDGTYDLVVLGGGTAGLGVHRGRGRPRCARRAGGAAPAWVTVSTRAACRRRLFSDRRESSASWGEPRRSASRQAPPPSTSPR